MALTFVHDPEDPRVAPFRHVKERDLVGRHGRFIAEGRVVVETLASPRSLCAPEALLLAENRVEAMGPIIDALPDAVPVHVANQAVLDAIAGFPLHRGILAIGRRPQASPLEDLLAAAPEDAVVVAAIGIGNHDNMGGIFRNAAAFGAHAVLLDPGCCDPFYRKSIRVSVGAVLRTPMAAASTEDLVSALIHQGFEILALSPGASERLDQVREGGRRAILLGSEGPGLPPALLERLRVVGVPMAGGFDSLNVATTSALALYQLTRVR